MFWWKMMIYKGGVHCTPPLYLEHTPEPLYLIGLSHRKQAQYRERYNSKMHKPLQLQPTFNIKHPRDEMRVCFTKSKNMVVLHLILHFLEKLTRWTNRKWSVNIACATSVSTFETIRGMEHELYSVVNYVTHSTIQAAIADPRIGSPLSRSP